MIDAESSGRLNILRFPLILAVIFIHNYSTDVVFLDGTVGQVEISAVSNFTRNIISQGIARTAVPIFFLMSGYFFFLSFEWSWDKYFDKLKSRVWTLLIPFLTWNIATFLVLALAQTLPLTQEYFSGKSARISNFLFFDYLKAIFGIDRMPIAYQFWFIRDLIVLVILAPIIYFFIDRFSTLLVAVLGIFWLSGFWPLATPSSEAALFFSTGAFVSRKDKSILAFDRWSTPIFILYSISLVADTLLLEMPLSPYLHRASITLGVLTILCLSKIIFHNVKLKESLLALAGASFFVFAAHEPLLTITKKIVFKVIQPSSSFLVLILYFLIPIFLLLHPQ